MGQCDEQAACIRGTHVNIIWLMILILLGLLLFGAGAPTVEPPPPSTALMVEVNGHPGVILDVETYRHDVEGWTPGTADLQAAEDAVLAAPPGRREPQIDGYRQYVGIIENGQRKIAVNSMCMEIDGWTERYIEVADGGACFWNAVYNVDTGELESLIVNGDA